MNKKYLGLFLLWLFVFSMLSFGIVSAQQEGVFKKLWNAFFGGIFPSSSEFSFNIGSYEIEITQILLGLLVLLLVYSIADFIPLLPKGWIQWVFSAIIALLAFLFVDADTIRSIGDTYEALGVALVSVIPLLILVGFSIKISKDERSAAWAPFFDKFVFLIFGLWLVLKWYNSTEAGPSDYAVVYLASAAIAIAWVFIGQWIKKFINRQTKKHEEEKVEDRNLDLLIAQKEREISDYEASIAAKRAAGLNKSALQAMEVKLRNLKEARDNLIAQKNNPASI